MRRVPDRISVERFLRSVIFALATSVACTERSPAAPSKRVEFSILEDYDKGDDLDDVAKDFDLFRALGVTTWRGSFGWDDYEPSPGSYDFDWLHRFAELAAARGITLRPYIGYTPSWASAGGTDKDVWNDPPKDLEAWSRFVRTLASEMRLHANIASYEIYNEENARLWWDGTPESYREVLRRGAEAVAEGNPRAKVLLGGMVYPDGNWVAAMCRDGGSGRRVDVVPFHAYPETWTPPEVTVETYLGPTFASGFVRSVDEACGPKPLWINEAGYATTPGHSEADQARWWVRAMATFLSQPRIEHIGIYEIKDLRPDREAIGDTPNYHLGLTTTDRKKKMAFGTVARLVRLLGGQPIAPTTAAVSLSPSTPGAVVYDHLFQRADGHLILFLWTAMDEAVVNVQLPIRTGRATEYALDGSPLGERTITGGMTGDIRLHPGQVTFVEIAK